MSKFARNETVICIINSRASLTIGKEYKVQSIMEDYNDEWLEITNDSGETHYYDKIRFMDKQDFRQHIINQIIK